MSAWRRVSSSEHIHGIPPIPDKHASAAAPALTAADPRLTSPSYLATASTLLGTGSKPAAANGATAATIAHTPDAIQHTSGATSAERGTISPASGLVAAAALASVNFLHLTAHASGICTPTALHAAKQPATSNADNMDVSAVPQQPIQQQHQHQLPHLNTQTSSTGFQNSGLWPQQSIPSQQPDSPIVNTQGNPFAPPRAYLLDEDEEGQPKSDQVAQPASSNPNEISSSSGRSEPASDRFPSNSFRPPQLESSHNAQPVKGEDPWQSLSFQSKSPYLLPSSSSSAALSSWQQFPESAVASSGAAASKSLESGGIPGWHTFDASQAGPSQIQPQQQQPQDLHATCPTSGGPGVLQPPQPWQQHANQHSSRHADKNAAAQSSHGIAHEDCDAASSILGSLSRGQVLSQKAMIPRQSSARY